MMKGGLIRDSLFYWVPIALFIWITSSLGDCFEVEAVCEAGRRAYIAKSALFFGGLFMILVLLRMR